MTRVLIAPVVIRIFDYSIPCIVLYGSRHFLESLLWLTAYLDHLHPNSIFSFKME